MSRLRQPQSVASIPGQSGRLERRLLPLLKLSQTVKRRELSSLKFGTSQLFNRRMQTRLSESRAEHVTRQDLEQVLAIAASKVTDPRAGIFGPESISWKINRESALFLGAGRAALLQLAHPWVTAALLQHSSLLRDPIARFHHTFRVVFTMVFGSSPQAFRAARSLHQLHAGIRGEMPSAVGRYERGVRYEANYVPALKWVYATLVDGAVRAYECMLPLTGAERDAYVAESRVFASLFGIPPEELPESWVAFSTYMEEMCASDELGVDEAARTLAQNVLAGAGSWIRPPKWYRALTLAWLPPRLRDEFQLTFGEIEARAAERARTRLPKIYRAIPKTIRFTGAYREACDRLAGRSPGVLTRWSNRLWIGEAQMPFRDEFDDASMR